MQDTDLAWLGGIWDGEGSISLMKPGTESKIRPVLHVLNTDIGIINKTRKILEEMGCNFVLHQKKKTKSHYKQQWTLSTSNSVYVKIFLEKVLPYIYGEKKQKGEIVLAYVSQRMLKINKRNCNGTTPYDEKDWSYYDKFRSSQTTREALFE